MRRALKRLLVGVVVLGLVGVVGVLLTQLNARTYTLEVEAGSLVLYRGRPLPVGSEPYRPSDPMLADAYAPLPLEGLSLDPAILQQRFTDRDELDRALFSVIQRLAEMRVNSDDNSVLDKGFYYLRRAEKLTGITAEQRQALKKMAADAAYYQGRLKLDDARRILAEGLTQLHIAADTQNRHARPANQMLLAVEPQVKSLEDALRTAVNNLSNPSTDELGTPAATPPPPTPAPDTPKPPPSKTTPPF